MQPFEPDHPLYGVVVCRESLTCYTPVEFDYYYCQPRKNAPWFSDLLCAHCAGSAGGEPGTINSDLQNEYHTVLPICSTCLKSGAPHIVRQQRSMGGARAMKEKKRKMREAVTACEMPAVVGLNYPASLSFAHLLL